jgi:hypothetical protein
MSENTVSKVTELRAVKAQADQHKVHSGAKLSYDQYSDLLKSAAQAYDATFATRAKTPTRKVYHSDLHPDDGDTFLDPDELYGIDSDIHFISANTHRRLSANNTQRLTQVKWRALSKDGQTTWDMLIDDNKHKILEFHNPASRSPCAGTRSVNLHEISAYDYLQTAGPDRPTETEYHAVDAGRVGETAHSSHDGDEGILANRTKSGRAKPRDRSLSFNTDTHLKP